MIKRETWKLILEVMINVALATVIIWASIMIRKWI